MGAVERASKSGESHVGKENGTRTERKLDSSVRLDLLKRICKTGYGSGIVQTTQKCAAVVKEMMHYANAEESAR